MCRRDEEARLAEERARLDTKKAHLAEMEAELDTLFAPPSRGAPEWAEWLTASQREAETEMADGEESEDEQEGDQDDEPQTGGATVASRIMEIYQASPGRQIPIAWVVTRIPSADGDLVRSSAARFARQGKLTKVRRGIYMYSGRPM